MKQKVLRLTLVLIMVFLYWMPAISQSTGFVQQIITGNSGKFEYVPPFTDFVTLQSYNPQNQVTNNFSLIYTQSVQSICIDHPMAYIAAQDSLVKFNMNTMQRVTAVADSGLSKMAICKGKLVVTKQYPLSTFFVEVLDTATLGIVARIEGISGDCGGVTIAGDTVYVAVNGGWMGTQGKIAVINPVNWSLMAEVPLGSQAIGINDLYLYQGKVIAVNKSPYGIIGQGSVTIYNPINRNYVNVVLPHTVGLGAGIRDSLLYLGLDYGIGSFNLNTLQTGNSTIIPDPGSSFFRYITSVALDTINKRIYANIGDYVTPGYCQVTGVNGDSITTYPTGISTEAVAVHYHQFPLTAEEKGPANRNRENLQVIVYPNPVSDLLTVSFDREKVVRSLRIGDITGRTIFRIDPGNSRKTSMTVDCSGLAGGVYYLFLHCGEELIVRPFLKK